MNEYKKNSLTLTGAVALGTGVMIRAAIFAQWFLTIKALTGFLTAKKSVIRIRGKNAEMRGDKRSFK